MWIKAKYIVDKFTILLNIKMKIKKGRIPVGTHMPKNKSSLNTQYKN
jgi:hypothetical protein